MAMAMTAGPATIGVRSFLVWLGAPDDDLPAQPTI